MASSVLHPAYLDPVKTDGLVTETSLEQAKTEGLLRELLSLYIAQPGTSKPPVLDIDELTLNRKAHVRWLSSMVSFTLPTPYTSLDASRPWLLYWVTHSLALLNVTLDNETKRRARETIRSFWNKEHGGFGGGPGQMAHLAPTYASVSALAYLADGNGQSDEEQAEAWGWIDR
jgi:protein farnesyltransferase subunit beta